MEWNPAVWVNDARQFLGEVRTEFHKVTFPSQKEAVAGTIGVVVIVAIIAAALAIVDFGLTQLTQFLVG
jgi:preprotein translocase SecE subunit